MAAYAMMKDGICINVIEWDGVSDYTPPGGATLEVYDQSKHESLRPVPQPNGGASDIPEAFKAYVASEIAKVDVKPADPVADPVVP